MNQPSRLALIFSQLRHLVEHYNQDHHLNLPDLSIDFLVEGDFRDDLFLDDGWKDIVMRGKNIKNGYYFLLDTIAHDIPYK